MEQKNDYRIVEELTREAFWNVHKPGCDEHYLVHLLRNQKDFIPELDLVAELDGKVVGNIMYAKSFLLDEYGNKKECLTFGPLSIHPDYQRKGIGKALLMYSFNQAIQMGYDSIVIFGHPSNYISSGFKSCKRYNVCLENGAFPTALLVKELKQDVFDGTKWIYHESSAYEINMNGFDAFEQSFASKEKKYQASQEEFFIYSHSSVR